MGAAGFHTIAGVAPLADCIAGSYFDATDDQMVLFNVNGLPIGDGFITRSAAKMSLWWPWWT